jgi:hypothetical protein
MHKWERFTERWAQIENEHDELEMAEIGCLPGYGMDNSLPEYETPSESPTSIVEDIRKLQNTTRNLHDSIHRLENKVQEMHACIRNFRNNHFPECKSARKKSEPKKNKKGNTHETAALPREKVQPEAAQPEAEQH